MSLHGLSLIVASWATPHCDAWASHAVVSLAVEHVL